MSAAYEAGGLVLMAITWALLGVGLAAGDEKLGRARAVAAGALVAGAPWLLIVAGWVAVR